ncbi:MAG: esterase [Gemmatimonadales bacterium]
MPPAYRSLVVNRHARIGIAGDPETATEAWLILHGYGMLAQGILHWFRAAERPGRVLIAPEGLSRFYVEEMGHRRVGASWLTREDREHDLVDQQAYLDRVVAELVGSIPRLEVHGFSQGVAAGSRWVVRQLRPVARLVCWGGTIPHDVDVPRLHASVGGAPVHFTVGDRDVWVAPAAIDADAARLVEAGCPAVVHHFDGGHRVDNGVLEELESATG